MKALNGGQQDLLPKGELIDFEPEWFQKAIAQVPQDHYVAFQDAKLHYRKWAGPDADAPNMVLVHGGGAHARWYDFIAPQLTPYYNVIALDLPGMGDSGWLQAYSREIMAEAVVTMVRDAGFGAKPALIGHSMGGMVSLITSHIYPQDFAALMICDFYVKPPHAHEEWYMEEDKNGNLRPRPTMETRVYEDFDTALGRFRLQPEQPCANQFIVDYIGAHSLREVDGGWTWKFDPHMYRDFPMGSDWPEIYQNLPLPLSCMFGQLASDHDKISRQEVVTFMHGLRPEAPHFDLLAARHHVLLDQPIAFASTLVLQMQAWKSHGAL
jgi:pimeloyl-ACP methyl ester carboxylesterase